MTKKKKVGVIAIVIASSIISCLLLFFAVQAVICTWFIYELTQVYDGPPGNFVTKVDSPISLEQAREEVPLPLPDEASDIYYSHFRYFMAYDFKVKFNAPLEVCKSHAMDIIQKYNENKNDWDRPVALEFIVISEPLSQSQDSEDTYPPLNITWFDTYNIENGLEIGDNPTIWIDTDRNIFYYSASD